jgi:hypothetical protein
LAVTVIETKSAPGIQTVALIEVPLVLLVEESSPLTPADQLWQRGRIEEPLISLRVRIGQSQDEIALNRDTGRGLGLPARPGAAAGRARLNAAHSKRLAASAACPYLAASTARRCFAKRLAGGRARVLVACSGKVAMKLLKRRRSTGTAPSGTAGLVVLEKPPCA